jgi:hypothetical protein
MSDESQKFHPGDGAAPEQLLALADEYRAAAHNLRLQCRKRRPLTRAPFRLAAIHAIELYLNAFLRERGLTSSQLRGMRHDLQQRRLKASECGLGLKQRTAKHLDAVSEAREYLIMRYGPELSDKASQLNRLEATLDEIADKVARRVAAKK